MNNCSYIFIKSIAKKYQAEYNEYMNSYSYIKTLRKEKTYEK